MRVHGPRYVSVYARACPTREVLATIANKWCVLVLASLNDRPHRFGELKRQIDGISLRMLAKTLRELERDGIVERHVVRTHPPAVSYDITELGRTLAPIISQLNDWSEVNIIRIEDARQVYDADREATAR